MDLARILVGDAVAAAFSSRPAPTVALWLDCYLQPWHWHLGVAAREGPDVVRIDQTTDGMRAEVGVDPGNRWWIFLPTTRQSSSRLRNAVRRLRLLERTSRGHVARYDHIYRGGVIDDSGRYLPAAGERGLNCASVVLAVFEGVAYPLVDRGSFAGRIFPDDVLEALLGDVDAELHEHVRASQDAVFLPTEVAGACLFELPRVHLTQASAGAAHFVELAAKRAAG